MKFVKNNKALSAGIGIGVLGLLAWLAFGFFGIQAAFIDDVVDEDGRATDLSGRQAYQLYGTEVSKLIGEYGGKVTFVADVTFLALGQVEDLWDEVAIAMYPNRAALLEMSSSPEWQAISVHRAAGLAGQLNIETVASPFDA